MSEAPARRLTASVACPAAGADPAVRSGVTAARRDLDVRLHRPDSRTPARTAADGGLERRPGTGCRQRPPGRPRAAGTIERPAAVDADLNPGDVLDLNGVLDDDAVVELPIDALGPDWSVRSAGASPEHLRALAELEEELPPIVVQHPSMRVIDGAHRVQVAIMRGRQAIPARLFRGSDDDAFVLAVRLNVTHGLALSRADRRAAAERIIRSHPQWSNRMVAKAAGLSASAVAGIRNRSAAPTGGDATRIGLDGRSRPVDSAARRRLVSELLARNPAASIRAIATEAGVSPSTVHGLRRRMTASEPPPAARPRRRDGASNISSLPDRTVQVGAGINVNNTIGVLARDPSLRLTETGRRMVRLLSRGSADFTECDALVQRMPEHCVGMVAALARHFALKWTVIAEGLEQRHRRQTS